MIIRSLDIVHFGKLKNVRIQLKDGVNIITGENESGKTTIASFVRGMFYGLPRDSALYSRYLPYDFEGNFGGRMVVADKEARYEIERSFPEESLTVRNADTGEAFSDPEAVLAGLLRGVTEEEYVSSGFLSQNGFRRDDDKWRETTEKTALKKKEEELKARFEKARDILLQKKQEKEAKLLTGLEKEFRETAEENLANEERLEELNRLVSENDLSYQEKKGRLDDEAARTDEENQGRLQSYKDDMLKKQQALDGELKRREGSAQKKPVSGLGFLIAGIILGLLVWGYAWYKHFAFSEGLVLPAVIAGSVGCLGLSIIGILFLMKKAAADKVEKAFDSRIAELKLQAENAEQAYQLYLDHRDEVDVKVENRAEREGQLELLMEENDLLKAEKESREKRQEELMPKLAELSEKKLLQDSLLEDIQALGLSISALEEAGKLDEGEDGLSIGATAYLSRLNEMADEKISVDPQQMIYVSRQGKEIAVGDLSTAAAQEVLLSVRLSMLDEFDPEKSLPVILDDIFANFDTDRLSAGIKLLKQLGRQVILLTCQTRERGAL